MPTDPRRLGGTIPPIDPDLAGGPSTTGLAVTSATATPAAAASGVTTRPGNAIPVNAQTSADIQNGTGSGGSVLAGIGFEPVPNPMSELFQSTYHFSFYLDSETKAQQGKGNEFVIAETGLTGMNIQEVLIDSIVGPNQNTKNAKATSITIKIYEPFGAMLPDLLYQAAVTKQISNYLKAPWFLKLKLWGYDEDGTSQIIGEGWTWQLMLLNVESSISEIGSIHTITAVPLSEVALNNQYCMLSNTANGNGATVGDVLNGVITSMNDQAKKDYGDSSVPFVQYAVEARDYPFDTKVGVKNPLQHPVLASTPTTSNQNSAQGYDSQTGQFPPGTDFPTIVDQTLARSETAVKMARLSRELPPATGNDDEKTIRDVMSIMHHVDTKIEYGVYNPVQGDYSKKITYIIKPYSSLRIMSSMGRAQKFDKDPNLNMKKAQFAKDNAFLRKQYDYLFTGLNTEVLKFDINVNFSWTVSVPKLQGQNTNAGTPGQVDPSANVTTNLQRLQSVGSSITENQTQLDSLNSRDPNSLTDAEKTQKANLEQTIATQTQEQQTLQRRVGEQTDALTRANEARRDPNATLGRVDDGEDLVYEKAQNESYQGANQGGASFLPVTIAPSGNNPALRAMGGTSADNNPNKSAYGALLNQLYATIDGNLQSIDLEIRGDPYWLGPGDSGEPFESPSTDTRPNFANGEHIFVFRFKLPTGVDETTGQQSVPQEPGTTAPAGAGGQPSTGGDSNKPKAPAFNSNIVTGFYACIRVNHRFSDGQFTQSLNATRIPGWSYENIIEGRQANVADDTVFDNRPGPSSPSVSGGAGGSGYQGGNTGYAPSRPSGTLLSRSSAVYGELKRRGYSDTQIAAIMGSWQQESSLSPTSINSIGARGLGQWLGSRRTNLENYAASTGQDVNSVSTQVNFFERELNGPESRAGSALRASTTLDQAMRAMNSYERFNGYKNPSTSSEVGRRYQYMNQHYANIQSGMYR